MRKFSCHQPAILRIRKLLETIGQYHCYLQYAWFNDSGSREDCISLLADIGVVLEITERRLSLDLEEVYLVDAPFCVPEKEIPASAKITMVPIYYDRDS